MTDDSTIGGEPPSGAANASLLPRYRHPPVVEVAISVAFDELSNFQLIHFGLFWERIRRRYPRTEHQPPLPAIIELFDSRGPQSVSLRLESGFPIGRCWYMSEDGLRLVQVQPDRFVVNWRKLETESEYPSYDSLRESFVEEFETFIAFVAEHTLGGLEPTQCELTYVNHLVGGAGWTAHSEIENVLAAWRGTNSDNFLPQVEGAQLSWQYRFDELGRPLGRLHVQLQTAVRARDAAPLFVLQLEGRGAPLTSDLAGVLSFLDRSHEWIVRGFTAMTTERMHSIWERFR